MSEATHVYPINDLRGHDTDGGECWCDPDYQFENGEWLVVHYSADGRECYERTRWL